MTNAAVRHHVHTQSLASIGLLAVVWLIAAFARPDATFHLGPVLLPLIPLLTTPKSDDPRVGVVIGAISGFFVIAILGAVDRLAGPALDPFSSAAGESVIVLIGSAMVGLVLARLTR